MIILTDNLLRVKRIQGRLNRLKLTLTDWKMILSISLKLMSLNEDVESSRNYNKPKNEENVYRASLAGGRE